MDGGDYGGGWSRNQSRPLQGPRREDCQQISRPRAEAFAKPRALQRGRASKQHPQTAIYGNRDVSIRHYQTVNYESILSSQFHGAKPQASAGAGFETPISHDVTGSKRGRDWSEVIHLYSVGCESDDAHWPRHSWTAQDRQRVQRCANSTD